MPACTFAAKPVKLAVATAFLLGPVTLLAAGPAMSPQRQREVLHQALNDFDQAVSVAGTQPDRAAELFSSAAAGFSALIESGLRNAGLEYNLGNCYMRLGRLGQAIVHYRRALLLDPSDSKLLANLDYARRQVEPYIPDSGPTPLVRTLLFVHYGTSLRQRLIGCALLSALGWFLVALRVRLARRGLTIAGGVGVATALSLAASIWWQMRTDEIYPPAVVVGQEVTLRAGRGEGYEPALKQPLGPGVELRILQTRGDWAEVRLPNGITGWLPGSAIERI